MTGRIFNRGPLGVAPTHTTGLIEFWRECSHPYDFGTCPECVEFASRGQLRDALRHVQGRDAVRIGQAWLDESDVNLLLSTLDEYDAGRTRRAS